MKGKLAVIAILLTVIMLLNVYSAVDQEGFLNKKLDIFGSSGSGGDGDGDGDGDGNGTQIDPEFNVTVPGRMVGDIATFDYSLFMEFYDENTSSGEWDRITLTGNGMLRDTTQGVSGTEDCFGDTHEALHVAVERTLSFTIIIDNSTSDEPFQVHGDGDIVRDTFTELVERRQIKTLVDGRVEVDEIPRYPLPIRYSGSLLAYPDPNEPDEMSMSDHVYGQGQEITGDSGGSWEDESESEEDWLTQTYDWRVDGAEMIDEYPTLHVNITSKLWTFLDYRWDAWISNEAPYPLKSSNRVNSSWEGGSYYGYLIVEESQILQEGKFFRGEVPIAWEAEGTSADFLNARPGTEFKEWTYMPEGGAMLDATNLEFSPDEAVDFALDRSPGLDDFVDDQKGELITFAWYNASLYADPNERAGDYYWNLTFGAMPTDREIDDLREDRIERDDIEKRYYITICKKIRRGGILQDYSEELEIFDERGLSGGWGDVERNDLPDKVMTLAAAEKVVGSYPQIEDELYNNRGDLEVGELQIQYFVSGEAESNQIGSLDFINTLTGIETPATSHAWNFQKSTVYEAGETYSVAVDAQTGALVYVLELSGNQLTAIFS